MSYDLAVWEGPAPASAAAAAAEFTRRMDVMEAVLDQEEDPTPPSPAIAAFVQAALELYRSSTKTPARSALGPAHRCWTKRSVISSTSP